MRRPDTYVYMVAVGRDALEDEYGTSYIDVRSIFDSPSAAYRSALGLTRDFGGEWRDLQEEYGEPFWRQGPDGASTFITVFKKIVHTYERFG